MEYPTEAQYAEAFGVELSEEGGTETNDNNDPEGVETPPETTVTAPEGGAEPQEGTGNQESVEQPEGPVQTPEERHRQAAARRQREEQARQAAEQARVDKIYADMFQGQLNPYTGKPITTEADFRAYTAERDRRAMENQLEKSGVKPDAIRQMVDESLGPMKRQMEQMRLNSIQQRARDVQKRADEAIQASLKNISALDPSIRTMEDIAAMPTAGEFNQLVQMGVPLEKAFKMANFEAITERKVAAAKTAAQNQAAGKRHLNPVGAADGREPVKVPEGIRNDYRSMMPDATDEEIQREYAEYLKEIK